MLQPLYHHHETGTTITCRLTKNQEINKLWLSDLNAGGKAIRNEYTDQPSALIHTHAHLITIYNPCHHHSHKFFMVLKEDDYVTQVLEFSESSCGDPTELKKIMI